MQISDFDYELPAELIAQVPAVRREGSRMLFVDRTQGTFHDDMFAALGDRLRTGDILVLNNTKVFPARLKGISETGARVEIFLVSKISDVKWEALARPARRLKAGKRITFAPKLEGVITENLPDGRVRIAFDVDGDLDTRIEEIGETPLPPYISRGDGADVNQDRDRYQTVYAKHRGAIAAPTAGLHFTPDVLAQLQARGVQIAEVTLHVGYGTFEPVRAEDLSRHAVMPEHFAIDDATAESLNKAREDGRRIVAVGTTTTRALESSIARHERFVAETSVADLTITPGYRFRAVDALLTNFHLPQSSLLILVSTFGGHKLIMDAYKHAVAAGYRFYSYGDCMFIA